MPWRRGRGYDVEGLTNLYTASDAWARQVVKEVAERADRLTTMRALGFCVSVDHARFMARVFNEAGIAAVAVWADSPADERQAALCDLADGRVQVVFSVDLFNEGVDVPLVDTLLLLRPTDSPVLFLQQLGRGLRRAPGKSVCTVLDFVGHHRKEFRFDRRFGALLGGTRKDLRQQVEQGFPFLPAGCHMELDPVASEIVLRSIRESVPTRWTAKVDELRTLAATGRPVTLASFLDQSGYDLADVYSGNRGWSDLCEDAGVHVSAPGPDEVTLRRAVGRLDHVDDEERLSFFMRWLTADRPPALESLTERERRLARMLVASVATRALPKDATLATGVDLLWQHPQVRAELVQLFEVLADRVDHVHEGLATHPDVPLQVHARYTRLEILAAFGVGGATARVSPWQTGVWWAPEAQADLLAFTLDKTSGSFSPTTRYRDYAISRELIHWESQGVTRADSDTGRRYQQHAAMGSSVMLFARLRDDERAFWFLGPATYVTHESNNPWRSRGSSTCRYQVTSSPSSRRRWRSRFNCRTRTGSTTVGGVSRPSIEAMEPDLLRRLSAVVRPGDTVRTLTHSRPNEVVDIGLEGVWISTAKSSVQDGPQLVPAWMLNEAWSRLNADRMLTNTELMKSVKRSSAVLALLSQLPEVTVVSTRPIVLRLA